MSRRALPIEMLFALVALYHPVTGWIARPKDSLYSSHVLSGNPLSERAKRRMFRGFVTT
jgi:hypothetical protein